MKDVKTFRPEPWLVESAKVWAVANGYTVPATGEFNFSKALHGVARQWRDKATQLDTANKDLAIYRAYMEKLAQQVKPFRCAPLNVDNMTVLECYACQSSAAEKPDTVPPAVLECVRIKKVS